MTDRELLRAWLWRLLVTAAAVDVALLLIGLWS